MKKYRPTESIKDTIIDSRSENLRHQILFLRGQRVMLDRQLAHVFGTTTKRLNEQVKRNKARFPNDFMFQLTEVELEELVANCDQFKTSSILALYREPLQNMEP